MLLLSELGLGNWLFQEDIVENFMDQKSID